MTSMSNVRVIGCMRDIMDLEALTGKFLLEAFVSGSWWDIGKLTIEGGELIAHFENYGREFDEAISIDLLRLRSRKADEADCVNFLRPGTDVCVYCIHPLAKSHSSGFSQHHAWYDARIISIDRKPHKPCCVCKFHVNFYGAQTEDVLDIEHRPLLADQEKKLRIDGIAILQAPYNVEEQPPVVGNPKGIWFRDSSSLHMPILANEIVKLQSANLISISAKQGIVMEISLRQCRKGDVQINMHNSYTFGIKDQGDYGYFPSKTFQGYADNGCLLIEEQEKITSDSYRDIGCIIMCIDKWDVSQLSIQPDDQESFDQVTEKSVYGDGLQRSFIHGSLAENPRESQNQIITLKHAKHLIKQPKRLKKRNFCSIVPQEVKEESKSLSNNMKSQNDILACRQVENSQTQGQEAVKKNVSAIFSQKITAKQGKNMSKRAREPHDDVTILRRSKRLQEQGKQVRNKFVSYVTHQASGNKAAKRNNHFGKHYDMKKAQEHRRKSQQMDKHLTCRNIKSEAGTTVLRRSERLQKQREQVSKKIPKGLKAKLVEAELQRNMSPLLDKWPLKQMREVDIEYVTSKRAKSLQLEGHQIGNKSVSLLASNREAIRSTGKPDAMKQSLMKTLDGCRLQNKKLSLIHNHPLEITAGTCVDVPALGLANHLPEQHDGAERTNANDIAPQIEESKPIDKHNAGNQVLTLKLEEAGLSGQKCKTEGSEEMNAKNEMKKGTAGMPCIEKPLQKTSNKNSYISLKIDETGLQGQMCRTKDSEELTTVNELEKVTMRMPHVYVPRKKFNNTNSDVKTNTDKEMKKILAGMLHVDIYTEKIGNAKSQIFLEGLQSEMGKTKVSEESKTENEMKKVIGMTSLPNENCKTESSEVIRTENVKVCVKMFPMDAPTRNIDNTNLRISLKVEEAGLPEEKCKIKGGEETCTENEIETISVRTTHMDALTETIGNAYSGIFSKVGEPGLPIEKLKIKCEKETSLENEMEKKTVMTTHAGMSTSNIHDTNSGISLKVEEDGLLREKCETKGTNNTNIGITMERATASVSYVDASSKPIANMGSWICLKDKEELLQGEKCSIEGGKDTNAKNDIEHGFPLANCRRKGSDCTNIESDMEKATVITSHINVSTVQTDGTRAGASVESSNSNRASEYLHCLEEEGKHKRKVPEEPRSSYVKMHEIHRYNHLSNKSRKSLSEILALRDSACLCRQGIWSGNVNMKKIARHVGENKPMGKHDAGSNLLTGKVKQTGLLFQKHKFKYSEETYTENEMGKLILRTAHKDVPTRKLGCTDFSALSDKLNGEGESLRDRGKHTGESLGEPRIPYVGKDETYFNSSSETPDIRCKPLLTAEAKLIEKELMEKNLRAKFEYLSASIESEIQNPLPSVLATWSMARKKDKVHNDLIFDPIINEDDLNFKGKQEDENSDLNNLWKEMEQASQRDVHTSTGKYPMGTEVLCNPSGTQDDAYNLLCIGEHEYILDEEIGLICQLCRFVKMEIDSILPPFKTWKSEVSRSREDCIHMDQDFANMEIPSLDCLEHSSSSEFHDLPVKCDSVWEIIPELEEEMNDHQKQGFEFLWKNIAGSLTPQNMKASCNDVGGCIIAHAPGTGKSLLIISFLQSYLTLFPRCKPLLVAPKSMLHTWDREFKKWNVNIPIHMLCSTHDYRKKESLLKGSKMKFAEGIDVPIRKLHNIECMTKLHEWHKKESVLLLSYSLFFTFTNEERPGISKESKQIGRFLIESPGLLILDEGHIPRSHNSKIWNQLMKVHTRLRILLSGTLFQNNFEEYFNTLCLARPSFVDRILQRQPIPSQVCTLEKDESRQTEDIWKEKAARRYFLDEIANKIKYGTSRERSECHQKLKSLTEDFIDVYKGNILNELPGMKTYTVMLRPTLLQETVLKKIHESISVDNGSTLELEIITSIASMHPSVLKDLGFIEKYSSISVLDLEPFRKDPDQGIKLKFVVDLVQLCHDKGERVVIFCQYIPPLLLLEEILGNLFHWCDGQELLVLHGKLSLDERQNIIDKFNEPTRNARVLLASIKACGIGISLTEASRVVLLDLVWNPSCRKQAISRVFRIGQKKFVYVYQLIASGTLEEEKYGKTIWKEWLSSLIFVGGNSSDESQHVESLQIEDKMLKELVERDRLSKIFHKIFEQKEIQKNKRKFEINDFYTSSGTNNNDWNR